MILEKPFSPVHTTSLSKTFPELKQYIIEQYPDIYTLKKSTEITPPSFPRYGNLYQIRFHKILYL